MVFAARLFMVLVGVLWSVSAALAQAQQSAADTQAQQNQPNSFLERFKQPDQGGGFHVTEHLAVVFGGIKQASGVALGPAISQQFRSGAYAQLKAEYSVNNFFLIQARYDSQPFWKKRALVISRLRWEDAMELPLYRLGQDSPNLHLDHAERKREASSRITVNLAPRIRVGGGVGVESYVTSGGRVDLDSDESLPVVPILPGLLTNPWYAHAFVSAAFDTRDAQDYSRTGRLFEARFHDYRDWHDGQQSFERAEGVVQQLVPTYGGRGILDLSALTWISLSSGERDVPFFLMPTLGGGDYLRGYPTYRFRDRDALLLRAEYRWAVHRLVDIAGLYEAGTVAPVVKQLTFDRMAQSIAAGVRVHSKTANMFRTDLAYGRDGFSVKFGVTTGLGNGY
jgi:hypothetical protein